jgi:hypothetical protein
MDVLPDAVVNVRGHAFVKVLRFEGGNDTHDAVE